MVKWVIGSGRAILFLFFRSKSCPDKIPREDGRCFACGDYGHRASMCRESPSSFNDSARSSMSGVKCFSCGGYGHLAASCRDSPILLPSEVKKCFECGSAGHQASNCPENLSKSYANDRKCFSCNEFGHIAIFCPQKRQTPYEGGKCFECGESGHRAFRCPSRGGDISRSGAGDDEGNRYNSNFANEN